MLLEAEIKYLGRCLKLGLRLLSPERLQPLVHPRRILPHPRPCARSPSHLEELSIKRGSINLGIWQNTRHSIFKGTLHIGVKMLNDALNFYSCHKLKECKPFEISMSSESRLPCML